MTVEDGYKYMAHFLYPSIRYNEAIIMPEDIGEIIKPGMPSISALMAERPPLSVSIYKAMPLPRKENSSETIQSAIPQFPSMVQLLLRLQSPYGADRPASLGLPSVLPIRLTHLPFILRDPTNLTGKKNALLFLIKNMKASSVKYKIEGLRQTLIVKEIYLGKITEN